MRDGAQTLGWRVLPQMEDGYYLYSNKRKGTKGGKADRQDCGRNLRDF